MINTYTPYAYQEKSTQWIYDHPYCGLFLDMGLGKTVCTLTAIEELIYNRFEITKVLVIAPLRVANDTWPKEIKKWEHLQHLRVSVVTGSEKNRLQALKQEADIYVINRENVAWLIQSKLWFFDMCVIDELSSFKSSGSIRFRALRKYIFRCHRIVGLTGTPAPNGLIDLWSQLYLIDRGERLGRTITQYRRDYFKPEKFKGHVVYQYGLLEGAKDKILDKISDICISMKKEDYLEMPERIYQNVEVNLPSNIMKQYKTFEKEEILNLENEGAVVGVNAAAVMNKLQQFADGAIYTDAREVKRLHTAKLDVLEDLIEQANGQPVMVFYNFKHDKEAIESRFTTREIKTSDDIDDWNNGKIPILIAHPASIGHGLNLQFGGHIIIWYGLTWSLELYQQANDRLYRQGQEHAVVVYHLISKGTVDERIVKVLENKGDMQEELLQYLKEIKENEKI